MSLIRPSFLDRVVVLGIPDSSGKNSIQFVATGFLYGHFAGLGERGKPEYYPYLVTNRHVIEGPRELLVLQRRIARKGNLRGGIERRHELHQS